MVVVCPPPKKKNTSASCDFHLFHHFSRQKSIKTSMTLGSVSRLCPLVLDGFLMAPNKDIFSPRNGEPQMIFPQQKGLELQGVVDWYGLVHFHVIFGTFLLLMAEIRRSPVEVGRLSHYLKGFIHPRWLFGISCINSSTKLD